MKQQRRHNRVLGNGHEQRNVFLPPDGKRPGRGTGIGQGLPQDPHAGPGAEGPGAASSGTERTGTGARLGTAALTAAPPQHRDEEITKVSAALKNKRCPKLS